MYLRVRGIDFAPFLCHWILELFRQCGIFFLFYYNLIIILLNNLIVRIFQFSVTLIFRMVIGALCPKLCPSYPSFSSCSLTYKFIHILWLK